MGSWPDTGSGAGRICTLGQTAPNRTYLQPGQPAPGGADRPPGRGILATVQDLHVPAGPGNSRGLTVPAAELEERFSHASGPGGQGVNTTDSRVQLSLDLATTTALNEAQRRRALARLGPRLAGTVLTITAGEHRSQYRNRTAARQRLAAVLRDALMPPVPRRPTKPTRASKRRRLEAKRRRSQIKRTRARPGID